VTVELAIENLSKQYTNGVWGLRAFSLDAQAGMLAVVGPAGAGKTTLMRLLATVMPPTLGSIAWNGVPVGRQPKRLRHVLGYLPQHFDGYARLSGRAFLAYVAALRGVKWGATHARVEYVLDRVGLARVADQQIGGYSPGMRRRVGLAQALLNDPQLLLIDAPGAALEKGERAEFCDLLGGLGDRCLVIVATDAIGDIASTASKLVLLQGGRPVRIADTHTEHGVQLTPAELVRSMSDQVWSVTVDQNAFVEIRRHHLISSQKRVGGQVALRIVSREKPHPEAVAVGAELQDAYMHAISQHRSRSETF
jgi:ABC-type multidrug transport system ATPase subunit